MEDDLIFDNILGEEDIDSLFSDETEEEETKVEEKEDDVTEDDKDKKEKENITEVNTENLFDEDLPESVGNEDNKGQEDTNSSKSTSSQSLYSSLAKALKEEGIFSDLDEVKDDLSSEDFKELFKNQVQNALDEKQKRIDKALGVGVEESEIQKYESMINYLNNISEENITTEDEKGEDLRKRLIYQDYVNSGFSPERAKKEVEKSLSAGSDVEDAKEALENIKKFYNDSYNNLIEEQNNNLKKHREALAKQAEELKTSILEDATVFGDLEVDKKTRMKVYDNIYKPVHKDPQTGEMLTSIQKYERENRTDFLKYISLCYTLTDGFKNMDGLIKNKVKKEKKKGMAELENLLKNSRTSNGDLKLVSGVSDDDQNPFKGWELDI